MFQRTRMTAEVSQQLIDMLTRDGTRDLTQLRLDDLETEICEVVDQITCRAIRGVLEDQSLSCQEHRCCPRCGRELEDKPPLERTLTCKRGEVTFRQPVKRCTSCRCDFFPSGQSNGD